MVRQECSIGLVCGVAGSLGGGLLSGWLIAGRRPAAILIVAAVAMAALAFCGAAIFVAHTGREFALVSSIGSIVTPPMLMIHPTLLQLMTPAHLRGRMPRSLC